MNCPNCGAQIPEGALFCVSCGTPVQQAAPAQPQQPVQPQAPVQPQQPVQPQAPVQPQQPVQQATPVQPQPQPVQPQASFGQTYQASPAAPVASGAGINGFMNSMKANPVKWVEVGGIFLIFLSVFIPSWVVLKVPFFNISESASIWESGAFWVLVALSFIVLTAALVLIWLDVIPPLSGIVATYKKLPFSQFYVPAYVFIFWALYMIVNAASLKGGEYVKLYFGIGFWLCFIGVILSIIPGIIMLVQKKPYYE